MNAVMSRLQSLPLAAQISSAVHGPRGLFVLLAITALVLYGLSVGRTKALASLLSIYVAYVLTVLFPYRDSLESRVPESAKLYTDAGLFIVLYAVVFILVSGAMRRSRSKLGQLSIVQVLAISVVQIGLLASISLSFLPSDRAASLVGPLARVVVGVGALWAWAAASLLIMPFMRGKRRAY